MVIFHSYVKLPEGNLQMVGVTQMCCLFTTEKKLVNWVFSHRHPVPSRRSPFRSSFPLLWHSSMVNLRQSDQFQRLVLSTCFNFNSCPLSQHHFFISNFGQSNPVKSTFHMDPNTGKVRLTPESRHHTPVVPVVICSKVVPPPVINCLCSPMN